MSNLDNSGHHTRQSGSPGWQKERLTGADEGRETEGAPSNPALAILRSILKQTHFPLFPGAYKKRV